MVFYLLGGTLGDNRYGPDPRTPAPMAFDPVSDPRVEELGRLHVLYQTGGLNNEQYQERRRAVLAKR